MKRLVIAACLVPLATILSGCAVEAFPGEVVVRERPAVAFWDVARWNHFAHWERGYWR